MCCVFVLGTIVLLAHISTSRLLRWRGTCTKHPPAIHLIRVATQFEVYKILEGFTLSTKAYRASYFCGYTPKILVYYDFFLVIIRFLFVFSEESLCCLYGVKVHTLFRIRLNLILCDVALGCFPAYTYSAGNLQHTQFINAMARDEHLCVGMVRLYFRYSC